MKIEIRSANEAVIEGYVNAVGRDSRILPSPKGKFVEQIAPKTFEKAISGASDIEVRFNHSSVLGSVKQGNLDLREDNIGLYAKATVTDTEVIQKAQKNELRGWSFGFVAKADEWEETAKGIPRRSVTDMELREVSILSVIPAYVGTSIEMRGEDALVVEERAIEDASEVTKKQEQEKLFDFSNHNREIEIIKIRGEY